MYKLEQQIKVSLTCFLVSFVFFCIVYLFLISVLFSTFWFKRVPRPSAMLSRAREELAVRFLCCVLLALLLRSWTWPFGREFLLHPPLTLFFIHIECVSSGSRAARSVEQHFDVDRMPKNVWEFRASSVDSWTNKSLRLPRDLSLSRSGRPATAMMNKVHFKCSSSSSFLFVDSTLFFSSIQTLDAAST